MRQQMRALLKSQAKLKTMDDSNMDAEMEKRAISKHTTPQGGEVTRWKLGADGE
jgi:hypothetical protein